MQLFIADLIYSKEPRLPIRAAVYCSYAECYQFSFAASWISRELLVWPLTWP